VASAETAVSLPFVHRDKGTPATAAQKIAAFNHVKGKLAAHRARYYKTFTDLDLPDATIRTLALTRLRTEFLPGLKSIFPKFDEFPLSARRALVDMVYNLGVKGLKKFTHLVKSANAKHWKAVAKECHRSTCRTSRNEWTQKQFEQAAEEAPGTWPGRCRRRQPPPRLKTEYGGLPAYGCARSRTSGRPSRRHCPTSSRFG
jgi:hypothetical protein